MESLTSTSLPLPENVIDMKTIYSQIDENNKINKKIDLSELESLLAKNENPPGIELIDDLPKEGEFILSESKVNKPKKPWEKLETESNIKENVNVETTKEVTNDNEHEKTNN